MQINPTDIEPGELDELGHTLDGPLYRPGADAYAERATPKNTAGVQSPGTVAVVAGPGDVAACVTRARERGHQVLVQATGHGFAGTAGPDVLLIDTSALSRADLDGNRACVGAGALWGAVGAAAEPHRMLGLSGTAPDVGVVGYTVHGGIGWMAELSAGRGCWNATPEEDAAVGIELPSLSDA